MREVQTVERRFDPQICGAVIDTQPHRCFSLSWFASILLPALWHLERKRHSHSYWLGQLRKSKSGAVICNSVQSKKKTRNKTLLRKCVWQHCQAVISKGQMFYYLETPIPIILSRTFSGFVLLATGLILSTLTVIFIDLREDFVSCVHFFTKALSSSSSFYICSFRMDQRGGTSECSQQGLGFPGTQQQEVLPHYKWNLK